MAKRLSISGHLLSRLTGTIFITRDGGSKVNIGLQLRFNARNEEVPGFSKKINDTWYLSRKVGDIMSEYIEKFPKVIENLSTGMKKDVFSVHDLFPGDNGYVYPFQV
jgi:5'-3' exoribonuclease 1